MNYLENLARLICLHSFKYSEEPIFRLASGQMSQYYINLKSVSWSGEGAELIGKIIYQRIKNLDIDAVGGMASGADPLSIAVVMEARHKKAVLNGFSVRKSTKDHGMQNLVDGAVKPGDRVVILEDVVTTGGSTLHAVQRVRQFGLEVVRVISVVDREEGGRANIENDGHAFESLITKSELVSVLKSVGNKEGIFA